jgi:molecular chaperone GrpE
MSHKHHKKEADVTEDVKKNTDAPNGASEAPGGQNSGGNEASVTIEQELDDLKQRLQRLAADYQNYQKRASKQMEQAGELTRESLVKALLPILDDFERALGAGGSGDIGAVLQGVQIVYEHLQKVLEGYGMRRIAVKAGDRFDPNIHEAMMQEENATVAPNGVVRELGRGYVMNERTLRAAKVTVAKAPAATREETEESTDVES